MCGSRKRGEKMSKYGREGEKGKFCGRRSEEEDNGREGRGIPPYLKTKATIYIV